MWYAAVLRFIRRRLVLGIIFASSLTYCIVSFIREGHSRSSMYQDTLIERKPFVWRTLQEHNDTIDNIFCRNSVQGKMLIVDDRGYVCKRSSLTKNGCCDADVPSTKKYSCDTCLENYCCVVYEHCVSCCLDPGKRGTLELVLRRLAREAGGVWGALRDEFELCLAACRTSSRSVLHENSYRDPQRRHCFGVAAHEPPQPS